MEGVKRRKRISYIAAITLAVIMAIAGIVSILLNPKNGSSKLGKQETENQQEVANTAYQVWDYAYTGAAQSFTAANAGTYRFEAWGAQGGNGDSIYDNYSGGNGAYTIGTITLSKDAVIYIHVGGKPADGGNVAGGYNGGVYQRNGSYGAAGGGATDFRLSSGAWDNSTGLISRIMATADGGGACTRNKVTGDYYGDGNGGAGGALEGIAGTSVHNKLNDVATNNPWYGYYGTNGGTQTRGGQTRYFYKDGTISAWGGADNINGVNSDGGFGKHPSYDSTGAVQAGAGGGYYTGANSAHAGASGGSSFISGHTGCNAVNASGTHTGTANHYSGYVFSSTNMIAGNTSMPAPGGGTETGHAGNGYARITWVNHLPEGTNNGKDSAEVKRGLSIRGSK